MIHLREPISGLTSLLSAFLAVAGLVAMIISATQNGNAWHIVSLSIFGASLILLYASSSLYHLLPLNEKGIRLLRRIDHIMIFILIAGTYTPFCLIPLRGAWGWSLFSIIWVLAISGIVLKTFWFHAPRYLSTLIYVGMGWLSLGFAYPLIKNVPVGGLMWLLAGGLLYTIGALFYALKWPNFFPRVFGFHELWHLMILSASFCHFWSVFKYLSYI